MINIDVIGDGHLMKPLTEEDQERDDLGFTNPYLHRRTDIQEIGEGEISTRDYEIRIQGVDSMRTTTKYYINNATGENPYEIP